MVRTSPTGSPPPRMVGRSRRIGASRPASSRARPIAAYSGTLAAVLDLDRVRRAVRQAHDVDALGAPTWPRARGTPSSGRAQARVVPADDSPGAPSLPRRAAPRGCPKGSARCGRRPARAAGAAWRAGVHRSRRLPPPTGGPSVSSVNVAVISTWSGCSGVEVVVDRPLVGHARQEHRRMLAGAVHADRGPLASAAEVARHGRAGPSGYDGGVCSADSSSPASARISRTPSRWKGSPEWLAEARARSRPSSGSPARSMPMRLDGLVGRSREDHGARDRRSTRPPRRPDRPPRRPRGDGSRRARNARLRLGHPRRPL